MSCTVAAHSRRKRTGLARRKRRRPATRRRTMVEALTVCTRLCRATRVVGVLARGRVNVSVKPDNSMARYGMPETRTLTRAAGVRGKRALHPAMEYGSASSRTSNRGLAHGSAQRPATRKHRCGRRWRRRMTHPSPVPLLRGTVVGKGRVVSGGMVGGRRQVELTRVCRRATTGTGMARHRQGWPARQARGQARVAVCRKQRRCHHAPASGSARHGKQGRIGANASAAAWPGMPGDVRRRGNTARARRRPAVVGGGRTRATMAGAGAVGG